MNLFKVATTLFKTARVTAMSDEALAHHAYQLVNVHGKPAHTDKADTQRTVAKFGDLEIAKECFEGDLNSLYIHHRQRCVMNASYNDDPRKGFSTYAVGASEGIDWRLALNKAWNDDKNTPLKSLKTFVDSHTSIAPLPKYRLRGNSDDTPQNSSLGANRSASTNLKHGMDIAK